MATRLPISSSAILFLLLLVEWPPLATAGAGSTAAAASTATGSSSTSTKTNPTKPRQSINKPEFSIPQSLMPYFNFPNGRPSFSSSGNFPQLSSTGGIFPQLQPMLGSHPSSSSSLYPNRVISYGPSSYGGYNGYGNFGYGGYGNYMFPNNNYHHHQPYLFDPYMSSPYSPFNSYPSLSSQNSFQNANSLLGGQPLYPSNNKPHHQQQQLHHSSPNHHPMMTPPFGYIEKQVRHTDNPADIANIPPPKAIMTTAADVIGLRGPGTPDSDDDDPNNFFFDFLFGQEKNKQQGSSISGAISSSTSRRKPSAPGLTYNTFSSNNKEHGKFNYNNNDKFITEGLLKSKRTKVAEEPTTKNAIKVKSINGTEVEISLDDLEDDAEPVKSNFVSEPIMPDSPWSYDSPQRQKELVFHHEMFSVSPSQPFNIMPAFSSFDDLKRQPMHMEPMPLFNLDEAEMMMENNNNFDFLSNDEDEGNERVYHCPNARDLIELSQAEVYPDPFKCDQFYYCKWGKAQVFKCPVNHFFNPYLRACDVDEDFACAMSLKK